jgi:hypothetical protein
MRTITVEGRKTYAHTGLDPNMEYFYRVQANNSGGTSEWFPDPTGGTGNDEPIEMMGKTAARQLGPPSGIMTEAASETSIKLSWNSVTGATGYEIQRWDGDSWEFIDLDTDTDSMATTETSYTHTSLDPTAGGLTEYYIIRTLSSGGITSSWSSFVTGMTQSDEPDAPTLDLVPTGQTVVRLAWSDGNNTVGATAYEVQYAEGIAIATQFEDDRFAKQSISLGTSPMYYVHSGLKTGTRYTYRLRSELSHDVNSAWTAPVQVVTRPARADLTATDTEDDSDATVISLTWDAVSFDGADLTDDDDYEIQRRLSADNTETEGTDEAAWAAVTVNIVADSCDTKCEVVDSTGIEAGTKYFYRIRVNLLASGEVTDAPGVTSYWDQATARTPAATSN